MRLFFAVKLSAFDPLYWLQYCFVRCLFGHLASSWVLLQRERVLLSVHLIVVSAVLEFYWYSYLRFRA